MRIARRFVPDTSGSDSSTRGNEVTSPVDFTGVNRAAPDPFEARLRAVWDAANAGDEGAYREALTVMASRLRGYFGRRLAHMSGDIEDLVQETLLSIHLHRGTHVRDAPISAWIHAIARHKLIDHLRRHGRREALNDPLDAFEDADLMAAPDDTHAARDLALLIDRLPDAERRAVTLIKVDGLPAIDAALQAGVTVSAIRVQAHRGLKRLAAMLRSDDAH